MTLLDEIKKGNFKLKKPEPADKGKDLKPKVLDENKTFVGQFLFVGSTFEGTGAITI